MTQQCKTDLIVSTVFYTSLFMVFDNENNDEEQVKVFAWSYGLVSIRAILHDKR